MRATRREPELKTTRPLFSQGETKPQLLHQKLLDLLKSESTRGLADHKGRVAFHPNLGAPAKHRGPFACAVICRATSFPFAASPLIPPTGQNGNFSVPRSHRRDLGSQKEAAMLCWKDKVHPATGRGQDTQSPASHPKFHLTLSVLKKNQPYFLT